MMFWQDVSSFIFNNRNLSSSQPPKKGSIISSVSLKLLKGRFVLFDEKLPKSGKAFFRVHESKYFSRVVYIKTWIFEQMFKWTGSCFVVRARAPRSRLSIQLLLSLCKLLKWWHTHIMECLAWLRPRTLVNLNVVNSWKKTHTHRALDTVTRQT